MELLKKNSRICWKKDKIASAIAVSDSSLVYLLYSQCTGKLLGTKVSYSISCSEFYVPMDT